MFQINAISFILTNKFSQKLSYKKNENYNWNTSPGYKEKDKKVKAILHQD